MFSFLLKKFCKSNALKSVQYILRQAREFPGIDIKKILHRGAAETATETDAMFYKTLQLTFFVNDPLQATRECSHVIEKCLAHANSEAHYVEGILQFFYWNNLDEGLLHLRKSAEGMYVPGTLIYGVLMLCLGNMDEGKAYIDTLEWKINKNRVNKSSSTIKKSLPRVNFTFSGLYQRDMWKLEPPESCHVNDMENYCELCLYYKQIKQFIGIL